MFERSEFVSLPVVAVLFVGKGVCACKRKPLRRRTACCPNSLLHPAGRFVGSPFLWVLSFGDAKESTSPAGARPGMHPRRTNHFAFSKGAWRKTLCLSLHFFISMQISLPSREKISAPADVRNRSRSSHPEKNPPDDSSARSHSFFLSSPRFFRDSD